MLNKISIALLTAVICLLLPAAGCSRSAYLALKFTAGDSTIYKVTTETEDSVKFEGSLLDDPILKNKPYQRNYSRTEITFAQQIQNTDDKGNAVTNITIQGLKCLSIYQNNPMLDFDSSEEKDKSNPLAKLIGQSYTIKIAPTGQVVSVVDTNEARAAVGDNPQAAQRTLMLLSEDEIKKRHSISALPDTKRNTIQIGDKWSRLSTFSFRQMGPKAYERIYTLKKIKNVNNRQLAIVEMNAVPSSEAARLLHQEQAMNIISNLFDNVETYTGRLWFDLTTGRIEKYLETLQTEWIMANPNPKKDEEPGVIRMKAMRFYGIEKIER
jgi:hypothetical protein